jgi:hypothetical protein
VGDGVEEQLLVEPEGTPIYVNKAVFLSLGASKSFNSSVTIDIPETSIPDSTKSEVTIFGNLLGSTLENLDDLIRIPSGE